MMLDGSESYLNNSSTYETIMYALTTAGSYMRIQ